jgi:hypothetical protein
MFKEHKVIGVPAKNPINATTILATAFVSALEVTDVRYDLTCYGTFMLDIPRRLGTNDALDMAVKALTKAFPSIYTRQPTADTFIQYGNALKSLRTCLDDPVKTHTTNTLCAIYLIMICQVSETLNKRKYPGRL